MPDSEECSTVVSQKIATAFWQRWLHDGNATFTSYTITVYTSRFGFTINFDFITIAAFSI